MRVAKNLARLACAPFGGGPRVCVAAHFAQVEALIVVSSLLRRWRFEWPKNARFAVEPAVTLRPKYPMPMRVRAR